MLHLVVKDSIDKRMEEIKRKKSINIDAVMDNNQARKNLSQQDMLSLFGKVQEREDGSLFVGRDDDDAEEANGGAAAEEEGGNDDDSDEE